MRKFLITLAAAASTVAIAAPAAAQQWYPQPVRQPYAYGQPVPYQPYGNAYGYNNAGQAGAIANRINRIQNDIRILANQRMISRSEYRNRLQDSREIERRFYRNARDGRGLSFSEMRDVQLRVARLEQKIARDMRDGRRFGYRW